jgi:hypothetical protein
MPRKPKTASVPSNTTEPTLQQSMLARDHVDKPSLSPDALAELADCRALIAEAHRCGIVVQLAPSDGHPPGKIMDAELQWTTGPMRGLRLFGFSIWQRISGGFNVTFPARQYSVNGERRSFALLRPLPNGDAAGQDRVRNLILAAYRIYEVESITTRERNG